MKMKPVWMVALMVALLTSTVLDDARPAEAGDMLLASNNRSGMGQLGTDLRLMDAAQPAPAGSPAARHRIGKIPTNWFWRQVSPLKVAGHRGRWADVLGVIETGRASGRPIYGSISTAQRILAAYGPTLRKEAKRRNVSLPLLVAVIAVESNGKPNAKSPVGAGGLMQLMPATARRFGVKNRYAPGPNIRAGTQYLDWLLRRYGDDAVLALAGYNAGEGAVDRFAGVPPYRETRAYVAKVAGAYAAARQLCIEPPATPRQPCTLR